MINILRVNFGDCITLGRQKDLFKEEGKHEGKDEQILYITNKFTTSHRLGRLLQGGRGAGGRNERK